MKAINLSSNHVVVDNLEYAGGLFARMKGLLGRSSLSSGTGLWIKPCKGVHTFGMRFAIDVIFLDRAMTVVAVVENLQPNRMSRVYAQAGSVIELAAGEINLRAITPGDTIAIES